MLVSGGIESLYTGLFSGFTHCLQVQGPVVQRVDNAIHRVNRYPLDKYLQNKLRYPLDSDLSGCHSAINPLNKWAQCHKSRSQCLLRITVHLLSEARLRISLASSCLAGFERGEKGFSVNT